MTDTTFVGYPDGDGFGAVKKVPTKNLDRHVAKGFVEVDVDAEGNATAKKAIKRSNPKESPDEGGVNEENE